MMRLLLILVITGLTLLRPAFAADQTSSPPSSQAPLPNDVTYVAGSTQKICQLTGETDLQFGTPTASQTETRYGLKGADEGYSFEHDGKLFFLFGDAMNTPTFNGKPNRTNDPPRTRDDNDAIAFTTDTNPDQCLRLDFTTDAIGAFANPVVLNNQGQPAITLRIDESPVAGVSDGGRMYVFFRTDNYIYPTPGPSLGNLGEATRMVVGVSDDDGNTFHYLYDFSSGPDAKFIRTAIAQGNDGYLYFWGTQGGTLYRHSAVFFARKPAGTLNQAGGMEYFAGPNSDGTPSFSSSEADAAPLFQDYNGADYEPANCMGEVGVEWNQFVNRWVMLYNCLDRTPANLPGIYMRLAEQPWGPWSAPQTIFNAERDGGRCQFIHRAVTPTQPACDNLSEPNRLDVQGGDYGPYFLPGFTTGDATAGTSALYYTMATFNPYTQDIMKTTIQWPPSNQGNGS